MKNKLVKKIALFAFLLALAWLLPFLSANNQILGNQLSLIHIPIILGGFILGANYGLLLGIIAPISRSLIFGMPPIYPTATYMVIELAALGFFSGLLFEIFKSKNLLIKIYVCLILTMIIGRISNTFAHLLIGLIDVNNAFVFKSFLFKSILSGWPGMIIQIILIPLLMLAIIKSKLLKDIIKK